MTLTVTWTPRRTKRPKVSRDAQGRILCDGPDDGPCNCGRKQRQPKPYTERLSATETRVLKFYKSLKDRDGNFCRSVATIAAELGVSPKTIRRANAHLKEIGRLSWQSGHGNGPGKPCQANRYWLIPKALTKSIREAEHVTTLVSESVKCK